MQIDEMKLNALMGKMVVEFGALAISPLVILRHTAQRFMRVKLECLAVRTTRAAN